MSDERYMIFEKKRLLPGLKKALNEDDLNTFTDYLRELVPYNAMQHITNVPGRGEVLVDSGKQSEEIISELREYIESGYTESKKKFKDVLEERAIELQLKAD